ncbi:uncharacterized protein PHACADRAFT_105762 [Phanerochaete carnosa HHB-10118-sp]|uniref:Peptidase S54 rhomboid domain-containing protein n=1 Tax=Phanerochaete carnosa (strain HHB-10118-sp) TaxID=650164 RepID=K5VU96_PHACS|nr:uncharacterized protein PHACADRAFT_105762 [Phanerochaete carnosa HHB-10118-sp]EKM50154.1 hypothetical protein PHACADRAFT_105762 [Phanerochaete carnosa HHB-10118-sp]
MLWTLRSPSVRHLQPCLARKLSFTPNSRLPRITKDAVREIPPSTSFREQVARSAAPKSFTSEIKTPPVRNQVIVFLVGSFAVYSIAAEQCNVETAKWTKKLSGSSLIWKVREPTSEELRKAKRLELGRKLQAGLSSLKDMTEGWSQTMRGLAVWSYIQVFQPILDAGDGKRTCWAIGGVNTLVWAAWQVPKFQPFMMKHFAHNPLSGISYTLLTSMFSHRSFLHLLFNCMALASFGKSSGVAASVHLMKEQAKNPHGIQETDVTWHFLAFYMSAGLFSGMTSHVMTSKVLYPRMIARLTSKAKPVDAAAVAKTSETITETSEKTILPSLGASGAIYAAVTLTALAFPHTEIALMIPPSFPIPIQWGVGGIVALDVIGALRGWRFFDHWAHLGGAAFGAWYYNYGPHMWNSVRATHLEASQKVQRPEKTD